MHVLAAPNCETEEQKLRLGYPARMLAEKALVVQLICTEPISEERNKNPDEFH
jgi:hypothetical protein